MTDFTSFWRLEPRPRENSFQRQLAAEIRDPLWFLARQWHVGEFLADDTGSVAFIEAAGSSARMPRWLRNGAEIDIDPGVPLERQTLREPFAPDLSTRVELGHDLSDLLRGIADPQTAQALLAGFSALARFRIDEPSDEPFNPVDPATRRFLMVCAASSLDGYELYLHAQAVAAGTETVPSEVTSDPAEIAHVEAALAALVERVTDVLGEVGTTHPETWQPERLGYRLQVVGADPSGNGNATMDAYPDSDGEYDWFAFDVTARNPGAPEEAPEPFVYGMVPTRIEFDGMPSPRFWDFEDNRLSLPDVAALGDDLLKMLVTNFMLLHSTDWYVYPFEQEVGTLVKTDRVVVHDVFGHRTVISRADANNTSAGLDRWTMFSITDQSGSGESLADYFVLPPSPGPAMHLGAVLEDVRFGRDEMANMAWGIERVTTSPIGEQRVGRERNAEIDALSPEPEAPTQPNDFQLRYDVQSEVPVNWIPLLPRRIDPNAPENPAIELVKGGALKDVGEGPHVVPALGAILNPQGVDLPYRIAEEEVPRLGLRVQRVVYRSRWIDGSTHLWVQRLTKVGAGESQSALQFDQARPNIP